MTPLEQLLYTAGYLIAFLTFGVGVYRIRLGEEETEETWWSRKTGWKLIGGSAVLTIILSLLLVIRTNL